MMAIPIANKYREGKLKRTLKREFKGRETVRRETDRTTKCGWKENSSLLHDVAGASDCENALVASGSLVIGQPFAGPESCGRRHVPGYSEQRSCGECIFSSSELEPRPM